MHKTDRRVFMKAGLAIGAVGVVESTGIGARPGSRCRQPDIVVVKGADAFADTIKALEALGESSDLTPRAAAWACSSMPRRTGGSREATPG